MKKILVIALIMLVGVTFATGQTKRQNVEQLIIQMEREWADAYVKCDRATLDRILAIDFIEILDNGGLDDKTKYMDLAMNPVGTLSPFEFSDVKVRVFGDAAITTGRINERGKNEPFRYTNFYVKREGRWQAVASQLTRIAQQ